MHTDATLPDKPQNFDPAVRTLAGEPLADSELPGVVEDDGPALRAREGLPKNYRSRHDRHYVEQLTSATGMPLLRMLAVSRIDAAHLPDPGEVTALTESIGRVGVLQPLLVRAQGERFVLIAGRKRLVAAREAHCREVPCLVHTADDLRAHELAEAANAPAGERRERVPQTGSAEAARAECDALSDTVLPEVQHALSSVQRSLRLLPQTPAATRERVAMRLISAELERAQWLVQCRRYLAGRLSFAPRPVSTADVARDFRTAAAAIALHGGQLLVETAGMQTTVTADAPLLTASVHGLSWALLALGETAGDPRVRVAVTGRGANQAVISVGQPTAVLNQQTLLHFFDAGWKTRPGGAAAELAVQLARYTAARHGADLEVASGATSGTTVTLTIGSGLKA
jgi:hypothetical protein